ncbi:hypothetical protein ACLVWQ_04625 [Streptomyces sp. CWNU-52B]|uniref:hypothetical protein n=1 Tax=unclassified Streptomyces TaxID=2593676 RepID=UPI0039BF5F23
MLRALPHTSAPLDTAGAEVLRLITVQRVPVCLTVHANGRRRYGYWQSATPGSGYGGCYVALPTDECDALQAAGRIVLGDPMVDPSKTTYPVRPAERPAPRPAARPAVRPAVRPVPRSPERPAPSAVADVPRRQALTA